MVGRLAWGGIVSRIFVAAVLGGLIAGAFYAVINHVFVVPLLLEAETYEVSEAVGDIGDRQVWWIATAILTAAGIAVLTLVRRYWNFAGLVLVAIPHIWGAPAGDGEGGMVPDDLAETFVATSLSTNAVFWIVLGVVTAFIFDRFARGTRTREPVNGA